MSFVTYEQDGYVGVITINRPEALNALNVQVLKDLDAVIDNINLDETRAVIVTGAGEKAFVAIALYFSILKVHPTPFCVMDEIEAALDDSNVDRYAKYLHKLTKHTQFIVITHRRGTMVAADRLYGITMQEKGVSTLVSVSLIENDLDK